jgi:hypothetical protein
MLMFLAETRRVAWRIPVGAGVGLLLLLGLFVPTSAEAANPAGPDDPIGAVRIVAAVSGGIKFGGWAADPNAMSTNITVGVLVDGTTWTASAPTSLANKSIAAQYGTGPTPGFSITTALDSKPHTVCLVARNIGRGLDTLLKCVPTPLGTTLSSGQMAAHNPQGQIAATAVTASSLRFQGWASDPDDIGRLATVVLYVDGSPAATVVTKPYPSPRPAGAGPRSAYDITVPVSSGMHVGCIWVVNVGLGNGNSFQGCRARDTRGGPGTGTVALPPLNSKVLTEAKKHIGEPYVWGATGPHQFDCSGLVKFSYGKFGFTTPRISEDQAKVARLIPASRAVAGDLVFTHDSVGDVYHVGIFVKPGLAVAAIDESQGVNYQNIWDPSSTTYGSFTHA